MFSLIRSDQVTSSKLEPWNPYLLIHTKWLSKSPSQICLYIFFLSKKSHISSLMLFDVEYPP